MTHTILANGNLEMSLDSSEQIVLKFDKGNNPEFPTDSFLHDLLEPIICNSELEWIRPEETGSLTDAPMMGIYCEERPALEDENLLDVHVVGSDGKTTFVCDVDRFWAFMNYQVRSPQQDLAEDGKCIFVKG